MAFVNSGADRCSKKKIARPPPILNLIEFTLLLFTSTLTQTTAPSNRSIDSHHTKNEDIKGSYHHLTNKTERTNETTIIIIIQKQKQKQPSTTIIMMSRRCLVGNKNIIVTVLLWICIIVVTNISSDSSPGVYGFGITIGDISGSINIIADVAAATTPTTTSNTILLSPILEQVQHQQQQLLISSFSSLLTSSSSLFDDNSNNNKDLGLWTIRLLSGVVTYFGFVISTDRPRGKLELPLELEPTTTTTTDVTNNYYLRVGPSKTAGLGLFVTQSLPKGTILGSYPGVVIPLPQHSESNKVKTLFPACTEYIWRFTDNQYIIDPTNHQTGELDDFCVGGNPSQFLSCLLFNTILHPLSIYSCSTALCRINEPSKGYDVNVITEEDLINRKVIFTLERDVIAGEELYIDYGLTYDRTKYQ